MRIMFKKTAFVLMLNIVIIASAYGVYLNGYIASSALIPLCVMTIIVGDVLYLRAKRTPVAQTVTATKLLLLVALIYAISAFVGIVRIIRIYRHSELPLLLLLGLAIPIVISIVFYRQAITKNVD